MEVVAEALREGPEGPGDADDAREEVAASDTLAPPTEEEEERATGAKASSGIAGSHAGSGDVDAHLPAVQVCVRMRPLLGWEKQEGQQSSAVALKEGVHGGVSVKPREGNEESGRQRSFRFDAVIGPDSSQEGAWGMARVEALVDKVVAGFHATIFAYGQTGSGKTHTMEGFAYSHHNGSSAPSAAAARPKVRWKTTPPEQLGFVPRAVTTLFEKAEAFQAKARSEGRSSSESLLVKVSFLQIYNEHIYDLLNPVHTVAQIESSNRSDDHSGLRLRWDAVKRQFFAENLFEYECQSADEVLDHYGTGLQHKQVASTGMNVASSRSHTVLVLKLVRRKGMRLDDAQDDVDLPSGPVREVVSKLALVDLAGSERASASNSATSGDRNAKRFHEAVNVNQSLFVLRKVITALSKRPEGGGAGMHIPYRESKLTSLLQQSIGGNGFLLMVACLSPSDKHYDENLSTLSYASQAASIKNTPTVNIDPKDRLIQQLEARLAAAHAYILKHLGLAELPQELVDMPGPGGQRDLALARRSHARRFARSVDEGGAGKGKRERWGLEQNASATVQGSYMPTAARSASSGPPHFSDGAHVPRPPPRERERPTPHQRSEGDELFAMVDAMIAGTSCGSGQRLDRLGEISACGFGMGRPSQVWNPRAGYGRHSRHVVVPPTCQPQPPSSLPPVFAGGSSSSSALSPATTGITAHGMSQAMVVSPRARPRGHSASLHGRRRGSARSSTRGAAGGADKALPTESHLASRSTSADTAGATAIEPCSSRDSAPAAAASSVEADSHRGWAKEQDHVVQSGLWDAVEELKRHKVELRSQLRAAEGQARELQDELLRLRDAAAVPHSPKAQPRTSSAEGRRPPTPRQRTSGGNTASSAGASGVGALSTEAAAAAEARAAADSALAAAASEREALAAQRAAAEVEKEALRSEFEVLARRAADGAEKADAARDAARRSEAEALRERDELRRECDALKAEAEKERDELQRDRDSLKAEAEKECDELRRDRDSLKERLDIFYKALEEPEGGTKASAHSTGQAETGKIGEKIEKLHSQLVLECVQLRSETASLKKKKWVLRTVLAKGGEKESEAIDVELEQLRQEKRAAQSTKARDAADAEGLR